MTAREAVIDGSNWRLFAACRRSPNADLAFGKSGSQKAFIALHCDAGNGCPVKTQCLAVAMRPRGYHEYGVWGGLLPVERRRLKNGARNV